ncbi:maize transposon MuDR [Trichosporon asahii var. asahii CBS 2479]|uniref:Transposon MuDR n=1 Tax=Trichosporon asahii var. asahii (strain ATCC 90039 / CBS 2479 / JCM 2466 / KCTC 7840 / NBRC 103889/ NCYC 2677 / UAMH 7654) TaxID=1186058 RepID=J6EUF5_TRIAS|nr:maize transposon MuDR [Trichosporon asahii var. asahii CBS 2479]EJT46422.1 maize transposon MuDR [Trichosporon asahii var. asahii CBS 2479]
MTDAEPALRATLVIPIEVGTLFQSKERAVLATNLLSAQSPTGAGTRWRSGPTQLAATCTERFRRTKGLDKAAVNALTDLCPFEVRFYRKNAEVPYRCTYLVRRHTCTTTEQTARHGLSRAKMMRELATAVADPAQSSVRPKELTQAIESHFGHFKPRYHASWKCTTAMSEGRKEDHNTQRQQLPAYLESLRQADPAAKIEHNGNGNVFISPSTSPRVAALCKPIVAIDACHSKGPHEFVLQLAVCQDGNAHLCIIAWGVTRAENYLDPLPRDRWARAWAPARFGMTTSNAVEQCNAWLDGLRDKPIVTLFHSLRDKVIEHAVKNKRSADQHQGPLTPRAYELFSDQLTLARERVRYTLLLMRGPHMHGKVGSPGRTWSERIVTVWQEPGGQVMCQCNCGFQAEYLIVCRHGLALLMKASVTVDAEQCVAPFWTTKGWRAVYEVFTPLHALSGELEADPKQRLPRLRGSGAGARKKKRAKQGQRMTASSQTFRAQN